MLSLLSQIQEVPFGKNQNLLDLFSALDSKLSLISETQSYVTVPCMRPPTPIYLQQHERRSSTCALFAQLPQHSAWF